MDDCVFCKIIRKEIPALVVYEDTEFLSFMELLPSAPGQCMVIPKKHGRSMLDYEESTLGKLMPVIKIMAKKVQTALGCEHITIGINHLEPTGVPHLHVHLIPRWGNDGGHAIQGVVKNLPTEPREIIAEKIRKA